MNLIYLIKSTDQLSKIEHARDFGPAWYEHFPQLLLAFSGKIMIR